VSANCSKTSNGSNPRQIRETAEGDHIRGVKEMVTEGHESKPGGDFRVTVYGIAAPKGSTKAFMRPGMKFPVVTHDSARTKPWTESIVVAAREALNGAPPLEGPVAVEIAFYLPRPKSAPKRVTRQIKTPDTDKLIRCCLDALTRAGVWRDDAQVVRIAATKEFAGGKFDIEGGRGVPRMAVTVRTEAS
jgi:Holliday junction resolvase RusA-like endonuclease